MSSLPFWQNLISVVIGGGIGALGTLKAISLSNSNQEKNLSIRLEHESKEKLKQRKAELRREVYLEAAEAIAGVESFLGGLVINIATDRDTPGQMESFSKAAAKVMLICENKTATAISNLELSFQGFEFDLRVLLIPLAEHRSERIRKEKEVAAIREEFVRLSKKIMEIQEGSINSNGKEEPPIAHQRTIQTLYNATVRQHNRLNTQERKLASEIFKQVMPKYKALAFQSFDVTDLLRIELEGNRHPDEFRESFQKRFNETEEKFFKLLKAHQDRLEQTVSHDGHNSP